MADHLGIYHPMAEAVAKGEKQFELVGTCTSFDQTIFAYIHVYTWFGLKVGWL